MDHVDAIKAIDSGNKNAAEALFTIASLAGGPSSGEMKGALTLLSAVDYDSKEKTYTLKSLIEPPFQFQLAQADVRSISSKPELVLKLLFAAACGVESAESLSQELTEPSSGTDEIGLGDLENLVFSDYPAKIVSELNFGNDVLLVGPSASGKTVIAFQVVQLLESSGGDCFFVDINATIEDYWIKLLGIFSRIFSASKNEKKVTIVIDNIQGSTRQFALAMKIFDVAVSLSEKDIEFLFVGWPSISGLTRLESTSVRKILVDRKAQVDLILRRASKLKSDDGSLSEIAGIIDGDCFLANEIAKSAERGEPRPSFNLLARSSMHAIAGGEDISMPGKDFLYILTALGMVEIYASAAWLASKVSTNRREIITFAGLRRLGGAISIGHRSRAYVINRFLLEADQTLSARLGSAQDIVHEYCVSHGDEAILQALDRIDVPRETEAGEALTENPVPSRLWLAFTSLRSRIRALAVQDPTWGTNTASVCMALTVLRLIDWSAWQESYRYLDSTWKIGQSGTERTEDTIERDDFDAIKDTMRAQDEELGSSVPGYWEPADEVDLDRMHRNWVLGLLLMAEATARKLNKNRVHALSKEALEQIDTVGAVYPRRVPWIGARLLSGISAVGITIDTSKDVERATNWFLTEEPAGPLINNRWTPGTGTWNDDYQATAMVIASCLDVGVPPSNPRLIAGSEFLDQHRSTWGVEGSEITIIDVVILQIRLGKRWDEYANEIEIVLNWILDAGQWDVESAGVRATEVGYESSKLAQVSARTLDLIFNILKSNLDYVVSQGIRRFDKFAEYFAQFEDDTSDPFARLREQTTAAYDLLRGHLDNELRQRTQLVAAGKGNPEILSCIAQAKTNLASLSSIKLRMDPNDADWETLSSDLNDVGLAVFGESWHDMK